jgi:exonuclease SbcC
LIEEVRMENFISHRSTSINLSEGVNVFVGRNGAGKSSVIDAITFALYGEHMRGKENRNLVRRGSQEAAVSVMFSVRGKKYLAERKIDSKGRLVGSVLKEIADGKTRQIVAGERKAMGESVSEEVKKITGLSFETMKVATVIQQGELDRIVTEYNPAEMKRLINEIIGIEKLDKAFSGMKDVIDDFNSRLRKKYFNYDVNSIEELESKIQELRKQRESEAKELKDIEEKLNILQSREKKLFERLRYLDELRSKAENAKKLKENLVTYVETKRSELKKRYLELSEKVEKARIYIAKLSEKENVESELLSVMKRQDELNSEIMHVRSELELLQALDINKMKRDVTFKESQLKRVDGRISELESKIAELKSFERPADRNSLESERNNLVRKISDANIKLGQINEKISDYNTLKEKGVCPVCDTEVTPENVEAKLALKMQEKFSVERELQELNESKAKIEKLFSELERYESAQNQLNDYLKQLSERIEEKYEILSELSEKKKQLEEYEEKLKRLEPLKEMHTKLSKEIADIEKKKQQLEKQRSEIVAAESFLSYNKIKSMEDVELIEAETRAIKNTLLSIPENLSEAEIDSMMIDEYSSSLGRQIINLLEEITKYDEKEHNNLREEYEYQVKPSLEKLVSEKASKESYIKRIDDEAKNLTYALDNIREASKYVELFKKIRSEIYKIDGALATSLRSWALSQISRRASEYMRSFGMGISQIEFREKEREVNIVCYSDRGQVSVASMSGGEKVAVALALRFALADLVGKGNVDFVILDEPTTHLDEERRKSLIRLISDFGENKTSLTQLVVITHDEEIFENANVSLIYKFEKTFEGSSVRKI